MNKDIILYILIILLLLITFILVFIVYNLVFGVWFFLWTLIKLIFRTLTGYYFYIKDDNLTLQIDLFYLSAIITGPLMCTVMFCSYFDDWMSPKPRKIVEVYEDGVIYYKYYDEDSTDDIFEKYYEDIVLKNNN